MTQLDLITKATIKCLKDLCCIPVGISNRHAHLSRKDMDILFGKGSELHLKKELRQPGQFAAVETVNLRGPSNAVVERVRVLGPLRQESQVEISRTDNYQLGLSAPVRESGRLEGTPGIVLEGPFGSVELARGVIIAWRHIHLSEISAKLLQVHDREIVSVETAGMRGCVFKNVMIRVSNQFEPEMHIDMDEANACGVNNNELIWICNKLSPHYKCKEMESYDN